MKLIYYSLAPLIFTIYICSIVLFSFWMPDSIRSFLHSAWSTILLFLIWIFFYFSLPTMLVIFSILLWIIFWYLSFSFPYKNKDGTYSYSCHQSQNVLNTNPISSTSLEYSDIQSSNNPIFFKGYEKYMPQEDSKSSNLNAMNQFPKTLEEEIVEKMTAIQNTPNGFIKPSSFRAPYSETHQASTITQSTKVILPSDT